MLNVRKIIVLGQTPRRTAFCAVGNLFQWQATSSAVVARWNTFESDRQQHKATVAVGDS